LSIRSAEPQDEYDEADARLKDRESEFHELTSTYDRIFRHPSRPLSLRVISGSMMIVVGTVENEWIVRDFGRFVDGRTTVLVPAPGNAHDIIHAFRPFPGIPERRAFAAECKSERSQIVLPRLYASQASLISNQNHSRPFMWISQVRHENQRSCPR
jgi:hypothetical protein